MLSVASFALADDVRFQNGDVLLNVMITDTTGQYVSLIMTNETRHFVKEAIERIVYAPFDASKESKYIHASRSWVHRMLLQMPRLSKHFLTLNRCQFPQLPWHSRGIISARPVTSKMILTI